MLELKIVTDYMSANTLRKYPGDFANLDGHNWQVEVSACSITLLEQ